MKLDKVMNHDVIACHNTRLDSLVQKSNFTIPPVVIVEERTGEFVVLYLHGFLLHSNLCQFYIFRNALYCVCCVSCWKIPNLMHFISTQESRNGHCAVHAFNYASKQQPSNSFSTFTIQHIVVRYRNTQNLYKMYLYKAQKVLNITSSAKKCNFNQITEMISIRAQR